MTNNNQTSSLIQRDLNVLWHPCSQMRDYKTFSPLPIKSAQGSILTLEDNSTLIDAISSWWCKSLGHRHPHITKALIDQAQNFEHIILANTTNKPVVKLCERIINAANNHPQNTWDKNCPDTRLPGHFGKVFLADNGSTAVEIAIKLAIHAKQLNNQPHKNQIASLANGYHGETLATLAISDLGLYSKPYEKLFFKTTKLNNIPYRQGAQDPNWLNCDQEWQKIEAQLNPIANTLAAIVYEPILQAAGNMQFYSPALLTKLRAWATKNNVYLIADEIATGSARLGKFLASHHAKDALPDFALISKGLTSGYLPLSAVLLTDEIYNLFDHDYLEMKNFLHSNTYTGNPLAIACANATLDVFAQENIFQKAQDLESKLDNILKEIQSTRPYLKNRRAFGAVAAIEITQADGSPYPSEKRIGYQVFQQAVKRGALLRPLGNTLYLFPPINITDQDLTNIQQILADSLDATLKP